MAKHVTDKDHGAKKLIDRLKFRGKVDVGILTGNAPYEGTGEEGATILDVATWNELGIGRPERSFIRAWFDLHLAENKHELHEALEAVARGSLEPRQALELLGQKFVGAIQARISEGIPPENAPSTIAAKGSSKPLIDTGQLRSSVSYKVDIK
jgi:hypothetical protein